MSIFFQKSYFFLFFDHSVYSICSVTFVTPYYIIGNE